MRVLKQEEMAQVSGGWFLSFSCFSLCKPTTCTTSSAPAPAPSTPQTDPGASACTPPETTTSCEPKCSWWW